MVKLCIRQCLQTVSEGLYECFSINLWITAIFSVQARCYLYFYDLSTCDGCWFIVYTCIRRFIHKFLNGCPFDYTAVAGRFGPKLVNHASWVAEVTPTDRPKSIHNRCVIELFVELFVLSFCPFDISAGKGAFVIGLSQISSLFSYNSSVGLTKLYDMIKSTIIMTYNKKKYKRGKGETKYPHREFEPEVKKET